MKFKGMSRVHLFLVELIIVVLFFSFAAAVTVQVFAKSFRLADDTAALNGAVLAVQSQAETDKTARLEDVIGTVRATGYTKDWEPAGPEDAVYTVTSNIALQPRQAGTMVIYDYTASAGEKVLYQLTAKKYYGPETAGAAFPGEGD